MPTQRPTITLHSRAALPVTPDDACAASVSGAIDDALHALEAQARDIHKEIDWPSLNIGFERDDTATPFLDPTPKPTLFFAVEVV